MNPDLQILFLFSNLAAEEPADHEQSHSSHPAAGKTDNNAWSTVVSETQQRRKLWPPAKE